MSDEELRDQFAGWAMAALAARNDLPSHRIAEAAYRIADAMMYERDSLPTVADRLSDMDAEYEARRVAAKGAR